MAPFIAAGMFYLVPWLYFDWHLGFADPRKAGLTPRCRHRHRLRHQLGSERHDELYAQASTVLEISPKTDRKFQRPSSRTTPEIPQQSLATKRVR